MRRIGHYSHVKSVVIQDMSDICVMGQCPKNLHANKHISKYKIGGSLK